MLNSNTRLGYLPSQKCFNHLEPLRPLGIVSLYQCDSHLNTISFFMGELYQAMWIRFHIAEDKQEAIHIVS